ncbi:hypothetical protein KGQ71_00640 [Patescibacteria group bacterium]|nr:hypothetical protein [Patescibacteria group bacterium]
MEQLDGWRPSPEASPRETLERLHFAVASMQQLLKEQCPTGLARDLAMLALKKQFPLSDLELVELNAKLVGEYGLLSDPNRLPSILESLESQLFCFD